MEQSLLLPARKTPSLLHQVCRLADLGPVLRRRRCNSGSFHAVYRVATARGLFAVRVWGGKGAPRNWLQDTRVAALDLTPRHIHSGSAVTDGQVYHYSVAEWIMGRRLDYRRDLRRLADALALLHRRTRGWRVTGRDAPNLFFFLRAQLTHYNKGPIRPGTIGARLRRAAEMALAALERPDEQASSPRCLVHNDLVRQNVIIASGHVRLIDWDWAMTASPVLDLCGFLSPFVTSWDREVTLSDRAVAIFLGRYLRSASRAEASAITHDLMRAWNPYNAMVANWVCLNSSPSQFHFRERSFYTRVFARSQEILRRLEAS